VHLAYIWIVSHLSAKNYRNWWKFDEVPARTNLLSFFGTRCILDSSTRICVNVQNTARLLYLLDNVQPNPGVRFRSLVY